MSNATSNRSQHSLLSPSASAKWLACPRSARLEATLPEENSTAAAEGIFAHARFEQKIIAYIKART